MPRLLYETPASMLPRSPATPMMSEPSSVSPPVMDVSPRPRVYSAPVKSLRRMTLTTPPIASEP